MPKTLVHNCQSCGGPLNVSSNGGKVKCPFCGSVNLFDSEQKTSEGILCPECGALNPTDALHCRECGMQFSFPCPKCGANNLARSTFCLKCGINFQQEATRQEADKAYRLLRQMQDQVLKKKNHKKTVIIVAISSVFYLVVCCLIPYATQLSPAAQATATAETLMNGESTRMAKEQLKAQYPFNEHNDVYSVYLKDFCLKQDKDTGRWYADIHFLYVQDSEHHTFSFDFSGSYLVDNLGNTFPATQQDTNSGSGRFVMDFDPNATSAVIYFQLDGGDFAEIPIAINTNDPLLSDSCVN